jgi:hypothetical protein
MKKIKLEKRQWFLKNSDKNFRVSFKRKKAKAEKVKINLYKSNVEKDLYKIPEEEKFKNKFKNWGKPRKKYVQLFYSKVQFLDKEKEVKIVGDFGIEKDLVNFFKVTQEITKGFPKKLMIDLRQCSRIWPSGVMFLASYHHWFQIKGEARSDVVLHLPQSGAVTEYVEFSGLKEYVVSKENNSQISNNVIKFDPHLNIKLKRETDKDSYQKVFEQISDILSRESVLDSEQLEEFNDQVLNEILINLSEHGVNYRFLGFNSEDLGWYIACQVHPTNGFISLCMADNGIGITSSILTGPQQEILKKNLRLSRLNSIEIEKMIMLKALEKDISGAYDASQYEAKYGLFKKVNKGKTRGRGFSRIIDVCRGMNIDLSVASNKGFLSYKNGNATSDGFNDKIYVGTLYNLKIPIKVRNENN